jgi:hypothetical protein
LIGVRISNGTGAAQQAGVIRRHNLRFGFEREIGIPLRAGGSSIVHGWITKNAGDLLAGLARGNICGPQPGEPALPTSPDPATAHLAGFATPERPDHTYPDRSPPTTICLPRLRYRGLAARDPNRRRIPAAVASFDTICSAAQDRQDAVEEDPAGNRSDS